METEYQNILNSEWEKWKEVNPEFILIDVREKEEFEVQNIGGTNIPAHEINENLGLIKSYENIVLVCSDGFRSSIMARVLKKKIPNASIFHLSEGIIIE